MITAKKLVRKSNLSNITKSGLYYYSSDSKIFETPDGKESSWGLLLVIEEEEGQFQQFLLTFGQLYHRRRLEIGGWSPWTNLSTGMEAFVLNPASEFELGGVKVGDGFKIDDDGCLTAEKFKMPKASKTVLGGIKVGTNLHIDSSGVLSANDQVYCLPYATEERLGGIKLGTGLEMDEIGRVHVRFPDCSPPQIIQNNYESSEVIESPYFLPIASKEELGGIKVGNNLTIDENGVLSAVDQTNDDIPISSDTKIGGIKIDKKIFNVSKDGFLIINKDEFLPPKNQKEFIYQVNDENYLFSFSLDEQIEFLNQVIVATMSQSGMLGGGSGSFQVSAKKEKTSEEVIISFDSIGLLDLYINGFNSS